MVMVAGDWRLVHSSHGTRAAPGRVALPCMGSQRRLRVLMCGFAMETQPSDGLGPRRGQSSTGNQRAEKLQHARSNLASTAIHWR